jgi:ABC-type Na+ efflux pump permease subunit
MLMTTTVTFEPDWYVSSKEKMSTVIHPAESEVPKPRLNIIRVPFPMARPTAACVRIDAGESPIWEWLELGLVVTLATSGFVSILLFVAGAGNI